MLYDLTRPIFPGMVGWPGDPAVECTVQNEGAVVSRWTLGSHAGTHIDAPAHYGFPATNEQISPTILLGPCRVLDLSGEEVITAASLSRHRLHGVHRLLLRTANSERRSPAFDPAYVGIDLAAAQMLRDLGVKLIGIDGPSISPYHGGAGIHETLLEAGIVIVENLNLAQVPAGKYYLICAPLLLLGADGAPARVWLTA